MRPISTCTRGGRTSVSRVASSFSLVAITALVASCSELEAPHADAGPSLDAPTVIEASSSDVEEENSEASAGDATDAALADASSTDVTAEDGGCACTAIDSGISQFPFSGVVPLSCYCDMPWPGLGTSTPPCMSYDDAVRCKGPGERRAGISTYTNCNFVTVSYGNNGVDDRHYDRTTHAFVGGRRGTDHTVPCGAVQALTIEAGVLPGSDCERVLLPDPCDDSGTRDAEAGAADASSED